MPATRTVRPQYVREPWDEFRLTARRLEMLLYLWKRRLVSTDQFLSLFGGSERVYRDLNGLHHNAYAERIEAQIALAAVYRYRRLGSLPRVYALDNRGADELERWYGIPRGRIDWAAKNRELMPWRLPHRLLITEAMVPFDLLARRGAIRLTEPGPLPMFAPEPARSWLTPFRLEASVEREDGRVSVTVITDNTFMIELLAYPELEPQLLFLEADNATEPGERAGMFEHDQTDFARKIVGYDAYARSGGHLEQFGTDNFRVLTVTTSERRLAHLKQITENAGGRARFWFTTFAKLRADTVLTEPIWAVAGREEPHTLTW